LGKPWNSGCPLGNLPLMPVERSSRGLWLFMIMFWLVFITQIVVIEPKLDVWYFMLSTTLISVKLMMSFLFTCRSKPGYIESEVKVTELLQKVPAQHICFDCSVIKEAGSHHC